MMDWKVDVVFSPIRMGYEVYVSRRESENHRQFCADGGKMLITLADNERVEPDKCLFALLTDDIAPQLLQKLSDKGLKTNNDSKNEGLLEATKYHLEDMRNIALKGKK